MSTDASSTNLITPDSLENKEELLLSEASPGSTGSIPRADASIPSKHPDESSPSAIRKEDNTLLMANTPGKMESHHQPPFIAQRAPPSRHSGAESQRTESLSGAHNSNVESRTLVSSEDKSGDSFEIHPDLKLPDFDPAVIAKWKEMPLTQDCSLNKHVSIFGGPTNPTVLEKRKRPKVNSTLTLASIEDVSTLGPVKIHKPTEPTIPLDESSKSSGSPILTSEEKFDIKWRLLQDERDRLIEEKGLIDLDVALVYGKLAKALETAWKHHEALELYDKKLEIEQEVVSATSDPSEGHLQMASTYRCIATLLTHPLRRKEEPKKKSQLKAMQELKKALAINLKFHGPNHPDTGATYETMGGVLCKQYKEDEAMEQFKNALNTYGQEHAQTGAIYRKIADLLSHQGKYKEALQHFQMALDSSLKAHGPDHRDTRIAYNCMGVALAEKRAAMARGEMELATNLKEYGPELQKHYRGHLVKLLKGGERELYKVKWGIEEVLNISLENQGIAVTIIQFDGEDAVVQAYFPSHTEIAGLGSAAGVDIEVDGEIHGESQGLKACFRGHMHKIVEVLLKNGVDSTAMNCDGLTALMVASKKGLAGIVRILLANGADHAVTDRYGQTALMRASEKGFTEIVRLLLANGADTAVTDRRGRTVLIDACKYGFTKIVRLLLANGADTAVTDAFGTTVLMWASQNGHTEIVRLLLANGADPKAIDEKGSNALINAAGSKLKRVSGKRHFGIVKLLVEHGADPNIPDYTNTTVLMMAAQKGYIETVEFLLQNGADITKKNAYEHTALSLARCEGHTEIVELLSNHSPPNKNAKQQA